MITKARIYLLVTTLIMGLSIGILAQSCSKNQSEIHSRSSESNTHLSTYKAILKIPQGNIVIRFYESEAPQTVKRVSELIKIGFYNGLIFHRVIPGFIAQTGDPTGTGSGGSGQMIGAEINRLHHLKGTVAMARAKELDSADSQFYIALNNLPHLDGEYTIFGQVVEGLELLGKIGQGEKILSITIDS